MNKALLSLYFTYAICIASPLFGNSNEKSIEEFIRHADTTYWIGQAEKGDIRLFRRGLEALEKAEALIGNLEPEQQEQTKRKIDGLRQDLLEQMEMAHDTLWGVFPLLRFAIYEKENWEWFDDPKIMSTSRATIGLRDTLIENWRTLPQMDVAFAAFENTAGERSRSYALENETAYLLNESPKFFNHNALEIATALTPEQAQLFYSTGMTQEIGDILCERFGIERLIDFRIEEVDQFGKDHFFVAKAALHEKGKGIGKDRSFVYGFTRDVTDRVWWIILPIIILLLLSIFARNFFGFSDKIPAFIGPLGFLAGFAVTCIGTHSLSPLLPLAETIVLYGFWYVCLCGFSLLSLPMLSGILINRKLLGSNSSRSTKWWLSSLLPYCLGGIAFCSYPVFTYLTIGEAITVFASLLAIAALSVISISTGLAATSQKADPSSAKTLYRFCWLSISAAFACAIILLPKDDANSLTLAGLGIPAALSATAAFFVRANRFHNLASGFLVSSTAGLFLLTGSIELMLACSLPCLFALQAGFKVLSARKTGSPATPSSESPDRLDLVTETKDPSSETILERLRSSREGLAPFTSCQGYEKAKEDLFSAIEKSSMRYTCIRGAAGTGKTRMARELVRELADRGVLVLEAECEVSSGQSAPYSSMATILEKIGHDLGTHSGEEAAEGIFNDLFGIVESVIPMGALVSGAMPKSKDQSPPLPREIAASLLTHFRKWTDDDSKVSSVLLLIDNGEKFDMASKEVLEGMVELAENETQPPPFVVLECTREMKSDHEEMPWFSSYEPQVQAEAFLTGTLGIDETLANEASRRCGESKLAPALLINWVESAINSKFFEDSEPPFGKNQAMGGKFPPPPESVYSSMTRILGEQAKEVMTSLEQAACIGLKFDLRILCETRERSKGAILDHLEHAEGMGLVQDVPETDEAFRFTSPIIVECLERRLKFPDREAWRQRAIETHKKLTDFYSQDLENNLFLAAKHACLSGTSYLEKAVKLTVDAASESFRLNAFREAADFASEALRLLKPSEAIDSKHKWVAHRVRLLAIKVLGTSPDHRDQLNRLFNELSTDPNGSEEKVRLLGTLAISLAQTDQFEASENCIRLAKSSASTDICVIEIAHAQAFALKSQHKCKEAIEALNEVIDDAKIQGGTVELKQAMAKALDIRANAKQTRGDDRISKEDRASSINDIEESLKIKREICDKYGQALSLGGLGRYYLYSPDVDFDKHAKEAIEAFEQNLRISEEIGNLVGQLKMPGLIAGCHRRSKNYEQAIEAYGDAVEVATRHHSDMDLAFALSGLASCLHETGQVEKRDESGTELAQVLGKMEPQTAAHLSHELDWLKGIEDDVEWAKEIKLLKESF